MKQTDLDILLREGEGSMLEYKESLSSSFARDLVSFANSSGGKILLGVHDDGAVGGYETVISCEHKSRTLPETVTHQ